MLQCQLVCIQIMHEYLHKVQDLETITECLYKGIKRKAR